MSHPPASYSPSSRQVSRQSAKRPERQPERQPERPILKTQQKVQQAKASSRLPHQRQTHQRQTHQDSNKIHRRKVLWAGGAITLLALIRILPSQVFSQSIAETSCEQVVKSGAEISRGQLSNLIALPEGSSRDAVRVAIAEPYCTLPAITSSADTTTDSEVSVLIEREAYPLAFDPEAWIVLNYHAGEYQDYDFVFKP